MLGSGPQGPAPPPLLLLLVAPPPAPPPPPVPLLLLVELLLAPLLLLVELLLLPVPPVPPVPPPLLPHPAASARASAAGVIHACLMAPGYTRPADRGSIERGTPTAQPSRDRAAADRRRAGDDMLTAPRLVLPLLAVMLGCAAPELPPAEGPAPPSAPAGPYTPAAPLTPGAPAGVEVSPATIRVLDHVGFPFRLSRLLVVVDGAVLHREDFAEGARPPAAVRASFDAAPGDHVVQILAATRVLLTAGGPECTATLRSSTAFVTDPGVPAELTADLYLRDATHRFEERLDVRISRRGVRPEPWMGRALPAAEEARCAQLRAPDRAVCRVAVAVTEARRQKDLVKLLCNQDKLDAMRVLARLRDEAQAGLTAAASAPRPAAPRRPLAPVWNEAPPEAEAAAAPPPDLTELRDRVLVLERQLEALGREADQCVGEELACFSGPQVTVDECFAAGTPEADLENLGLAPGPDSRERKRLSQ
jgi:hypothetical protein